MTLPMAAYGVLETDCHRASTNRRSQTVSRYIVGIALMSACLAGCASIISGTSQEVAVNTKPDGASCDLQRDGKVIGHIDQTPGSLVVSRRNSDILVECNKADHQGAIATNENDVEAWTFGNLFFGGLVGLAVDAFSGAINSYEDSTTLVLNQSLAKATTSSSDGSDVR
jgi:hypothetical protein